MTDPLASMIAGLEAKTGRPLDWWLEAVRTSGLARHGEIVAMLERDHGLSHGYANMAAHGHLGSSAAEADPDDLCDVAVRREGAPAPDLRRRGAFGGGLRRRRGELPQEGGGEPAPFEAVRTDHPGDKTRVDLGINLKGEPATGRLEAATGMCTHRVRLTVAGDVDDEVAGWLMTAYQRA